MNQRCGKGPAAGLPSTVVKSQGPPRRVLHSSARIDPPRTGIIDNCVLGLSSHRVEVGHSRSTSGLLTPGPICGKAARLFRIDLAQGDATPISGLRPFFSITVVEFIHDPSVTVAKLQSFATIAQHPGKGTDNLGHSGERSVRWIRTQHPVVARLHDRSFRKSEIDALGKRPSRHIHSNCHLIVQLHPLRLPDQSRMIVNFINSHHAIRPLPHRGISSKKEEEGMNQASFHEEGVAYTKQHLPNHFKDKETFPYRDSSSSYTFPVEHDLSVFDV